jgi:hypothetical protein
MSDFWLSGIGSLPTGRPEDSFVGDFSVIPEGTCAPAVIKLFNLVEKENKYTNMTDKFYNVLFKLTDGAFKGREVTLKIKCFSGKPEQIQRNLNMLKLILDICGYKPTHNGAPTDLELGFTMGKPIAVKIGEYSIPKTNEPGYIEGNFVRECHPVGSIATETGIKAEVKARPTESALTRNANVPDLNDDLPF